MKLRGEPTFWLGAKSMAERGCFSCGALG